MPTPCDSDVGLMIHGLIDRLESTDWISFEFVTAKQICLDKGTGGFQELEDKLRNRKHGALWLFFRVSKDGLDAYILVQYFGSESTADDAIQMDESESRLLEIVRSVHGMKHNRLVYASLDDRSDGRMHVKIPELVDRQMEFTLDNIFNVLEIERLPPSDVSVLADTGYHSPLLYSSIDLEPDTA